MKINVIKFFRTNKPEPLPSPIITKSGERKRIFAGGCKSFAFGKCDTRLTQKFQDVQSPLYYLSPPFLQGKDKYEYAQVYYLLYFYISHFNYSKSPKNIVNIALQSNEKLRAIF